MGEKPKTIILDENNLKKLPTEISEPLADIFDEGGVIEILPGGGKGEAVQIYDANTNTLLTCKDKTKPTKSEI